MTLALVHSHPTYKPRAWQVRAKEAFLAHRSDRGCLIVAATGGGKTAFGHYLAVDYLDRGERVLWIADQKTLVKQPFATLARWWPDLVAKAGIVMASRNEPGAQIVYASKDTLKNDKRMAELLEAGPFSLVVADECHKSVSPTWLKVLEAASHDQTRLLGLTATPHRDDTKNLSDMWELAFSYGILDALEDDVLVPPFAAVEKVPHLDLDGVRTTNGDYNTQDLGEALLKAHIVEHTVAAMAQSYVFEELPFRERKVFEGLRGRQVLVHTATKEQARLTAEALNKDGWEARYVSGDTSDSDLERIFKLFEERRINVLLAAQKLSVGVDLPVADAEVFASPTRSWVLYVQRLGRGLRTNGTKKNCLVLDLVGCTRDHSIVSAPVLVDGTDCEKSDDGRHRYLPLEGSGEGKCQDCGKLIRCYKLGGGHDFKGGKCKACGMPQCEDSPDLQHHFVPSEGHKRRCVHCPLEIPDPLASLVDRAPSQKEPVNWQPIAGGERKCWAAAIGKIGVMFTVQHSEDAFRVFLYTRNELVPLSPGLVDGRMSRLLTDDIARRGTKVRGFYGGVEFKAAGIQHARMESLARRLNVWER